MGKKNQDLLITPHCRVGQVVSISTSIFEGRPISGLCIWKIFFFLFYKEWKKLKFYFLHWKRNSCWVILKFTNCLKHISKLQQLFLAIIAVLWRWWFGLHLSSGWASERSQICLSPNMKGSRSKWCYLSVNCNSLLTPYKIPQFPMI